MHSRIFFLAENSFSTFSCKTTAGGFSEQLLMPPPHPPLHTHTHLFLASFFVNYDCTLQFLWLPSLCERTEFVPCHFRGLNNIGAAEFYNLGNWPFIAVVQKIGPVCFLLRVLFFFFFFFEVQHCEDTYAQNFAACASSNILALLHKTKEEMRYYVVIETTEIKPTVCRL